MTYEFIAACEQKNIVTFYLLAHSTHITQPLDVCCFQPYKHWHQRGVEDLAQDDGKDNFSKITFLRILQQIRDHTFTKRNIKTSFRRAGIWPHCAAPVMHTLRLVMDKKLGTEEVGGREYRWDLDDRDKHIRVPQSNAPKLRWGGQRKTIWDENAIETDKYDSPSNSELLSLDEDDVGDDSEDSMELPPHPLMSRDFHDTLKETVNQLISRTRDPNCRNLAVFDEYGVEDSGIKGLDPRWYAKTPYTQTPYGARGICKNFEFLDKYEHEISSPSRRLSNGKF
jgi:hypothetical protein